MVNASAAAAAVGQTEAHAREGTQRNGKHQPEDRASGADVKGVIGAPEVRRTIGLDPFVCGYRKRLQCWSERLRQCVVLRPGRGFKPGAAEVRRGGEATIPQCRGFDVYEEV